MSRQKDPKWTRAVAINLTELFKRDQTPHTRLGVSMPTASDTLS